MAGRDTAVQIVLECWVDTTSRETLRLRLFKDSFPENWPEKARRVVEAIYGSIDVAIAELEAEYPGKK